MPLISRAAVLAAGASLLIAPAAFGSGSGSGNSSISGNLGGSGASASGFGAGGPSGTSGINGGGGGGAASGNSTNNPPSVCTISTFNTTVGIDPTNGLPEVSTAVAIPAGCPGRSSFTVQYTNQNTGRIEYTYENSTGLATSGNATAVTPGVSTTVAVEGFAHGTPYTVHIEIDSAGGQLITQLNQTVVMPA